MSRKIRLTLLVLSAVFCASVLAAQQIERAAQPDAGRLMARAVGEDGEHTLTVLSAPYTLDRIYMSMHGPYSAQPNVALLPDDPDRLIWVTGIDSQVVDADTLEPQSAEFFCHGNVALATGNVPDVHNATFGGVTNLDWRLFTLVPGQLSIRLPAGFGIPMRGRETIDVDSMTLNMNVTDRTVRVRVKSDVRFVPDDDSRRPMTAVFRRALYGLMPIGDAQLTPERLEAAKKACTTCGPHPGQTASKGGILGQFGKDMTIHWMVPPGRFEYRTEVTQQLDLPFDTTAHLVTAHLHPYGKSVTLRDMTTGQTITTLGSRDFADKVGVAHMEQHVSTQGITLKRDHRYELVTVYENKTGQAVDAMSIVYLYLAEQAFDEGTVKTVSIK